MIYWALQKLGAIYTPLNHRLSIKEVEYCVNDAEAKAIVYESSSQNAVLGANFTEKPMLIGIEDNDGVDISYLELADRSPRSYEKPNLDENDISIMLYTSGTTGRPKGVPKTHRNEYASAMAHIVQNQYQLWESTLGVMPLYHTMGVHIVELAELGAGDETWATAMGITDYNKNLKLQYKKEIKLSENEFLFVSNSDSLYPTLEHYLKDHKTMEIGGVPLKAKSGKVQTLSVSNADSTRDLLIIVPDHAAERLQPLNNYLSFSYNSNRSIQEREVTEIKKETMK
jgi:hypothetical protein